MSNAGVAAQGFVSRAPRLGFVGGFDGVRGIGILMVLTQHAYPNLYPSAAGFIDIFFVLSAFLIVSLLMQEYRDRSGIHMRKFYARRGLRLLPSAYLCLVAWIVASLLFDRERLAWVLQDALAAVTYVYQLVFPVGLGYVDQAAAEQRSIDQFWSLAVEEQFYLLIAVTALICLRKRWMTQLAIGLCVLAAWIGWQRWTGHTGPWNGGVPTNSSVPARGLSLLWLSRPDSLMWGVGLAVLNARLPDPLPERWRIWLPRVGLVGLAIAGATMLMASPFLAETAQSAGLPFPYVQMAPVPGAEEGRFWISFGHTVCALACAPALLSMARVKDWWGNRALSWKPVRFLGRMSYTLYVWHTLVYFLILDVMGGDGVLGEKWRAPILTVLTIVICLPVFYGVEQRMMRMKLRFSTEKEVVDLNTGQVISVEEARARAGEGSRGERP